MGLSWGYTPRILTLDPNFQGDIQVWRMGCLGHVYPDKKETPQGRIRVRNEDERTYNLLANYNDVSRGHPKKAV